MAGKKAKKELDLWFPALTKAKRDTWWRRD